MINLPTVNIPNGLPKVDDTSAQHSKKFAQILANKIAAAGGSISFEQWMLAALYEPGYGYYSAGSTKFNQAGDFITAPETSDLFGFTLANQVAQILDMAGSNTILEFGAGTGALAKSLIKRLTDLGLKIEYQILELSADLKQRQQENLHGLAVTWLDTLPNNFKGCVIANEVLDAMPVNIFHTDDNGNAHILGVKNTSDDPEQPVFAWATVLDEQDITAQINNRTRHLPNYLSEINLQAEAWIKQIGNWLNTGAAIIIDYGFPQNEYYHPQRKQGSLMCHFRHFAHDQPLIMPGIQDITAHVDFTAMADAALDADLDVMGYTSQARFLLNCGLTDIIQVGIDDPASRAKQLANINTLISEAEMGELFKVLVIGKNIDQPLLGFSRSDRRDFL